MIESSEMGRPIAHRRPSDGVTHDLEEHLRSAALLAGRFAEAWGASEAAALAALWHDLGKYAAEFQAMITSSDPEAHLEGVATGARQRVNHSSAGALLAVERFGSRFGRLLAYPIAGHHTGLPDWIGEGARTGLKDRLAEKGHLERARAGQPPRGILDAASLIALFQLMTLDLSDQETDALATLLRRTIDDDRYPLSPRIQTLKGILSKLRPEPASEPLPSPKAYAPPRATTARRRRRG
jgi:CRISPR-associated endonuclease Cas3-HD